MLGLLTLEPTMPYSLWSRGRLLGSTTLDFVRCIPLHRMGFLDAAPGAEPLLEMATAVSPAMMALSRRMRAFHTGSLTERGATLARELIRETTEFADLSAALAQEEGLALELHREDGSIVPTEWIGLKDTDWLLALGRGEFDDRLDDRHRPLYEDGDDPDDDEPMDPELRAAIEHDLAILDEEPWMRGDPSEPDLGIVEKSPFTRWQIQVKLVREEDVP
jgi:hypothetical protein